MANPFNPAPDPQCQASPDGEYVGSLTNAQGDTAADGGAAGGHSLADSPAFIGFRARLGDNQLDGRSPAPSGVTADDLIRNGLD
jgi:hypothetical protein